MNYCARHAQSYTVECIGCAQDKQPRIWFECQKEYLSARDAEVLDVSEGVHGEDRVEFKCRLCGGIHTNAQVRRG